MNTEWLIENEIPQESWDAYRVWMFHIRHKSLSRADRTPAQAFLDSLIDTADPPVGRMSTNELLAGYRAWRLYRSSEGDVSDRLSEAIDTLAEQAEIPNFAVAGDSVPP